MAANPRTGLFLPTTPIFDVGDIANAVQQKELIIRLTQKINDIVLALNLKDTGYYILDQFVNGQVYFPNPNLSATTPQQPLYRQVFRKVINFGTLPNAGAKAVAHGLAPTNLFTFTRIYATASDTTGLNYIPVPLTQVGGNITDLTVDNTNVTITTNYNATNFDTCYVVLELLKN